MMPTNFYLAHDGTFSQHPEVFEDESDAIAHAHEMAAYEKKPWYVAACLMPNAVAHKALPPKKGAPKESDD